MLVVSQAQMMCRRKASSSSTWGSMSEREAAAVEEVQWQTPGSLCVNACRSDGLGRMLPLVTWRHFRAMGGRELSVFVDRGGFH